MNVGKSSENSVLEAVDEALAIFGESSKRTLYYLIAKRYHIKREDIPNKMAAFHEALADLLDVGSTVVEKIIAEKLCKKSA